MFKDFTGNDWWQHDPRSDHELRTLASREERLRRVARARAAYERDHAERLRFAQYQAGQGMRGYK